MASSPQVPSTSLPFPTHCMAWKSVHCGSCSSLEFCLLLFTHTQLFTVFLVLVCKKERAKKRRREGSLSHLAFGWLALALKCHLKRLPRNPFGFPSLFPLPSPPKPLSSCPFDRENSIPLPPSASPHVSVSCLSEPIWGRVSSHAPSLGSVKISSSLLAILLSE